MNTYIHGIAQLDMNTSGSFHFSDLCSEPRCPSAPFKIWGISSLSKSGTTSLNSQRSRWIPRLNKKIIRTHHDAKAHQVGDCILFRATCFSSG